jgi:cytosine/adenosine deaminase-related metal-dependent hydrolase
MDSYLSADWVYPVSSAPIKDGVISLDHKGVITGVFSAEEAKNLQNHVQKYKGILVPGFINTHCHLELSHLKGKIAEHTGLPSFVQQVISQRAASEEEICRAMLEADEEMYNNGIVAIGDISNQLISRAIKLNSKIYYHTFVEAMGFNPERAKEIIINAQKVRDAFFPLKATVVPHAPYSVSEELFAEIANLSGTEEVIVSIHNQETPDENAFFVAKKGHFLKLYEFLGLDITFFKASGKSSLQTYLSRLSAKARKLLVHNTFTSEEDLIYANSVQKELYWCLCPNANLYIEGKLPHIGLFLQSEAVITLGTDSLASNHQLSILDEMKVLQEKESVPLEKLLRWATLNGARFLGVDHQFGSFENGKQPGVNLIEHMDEDQISAASRLRRLV